MYAQGWAPFLRIAAGQRMPNPSADYKPHHFHYDAPMSSLHDLLIDSLLYDVLCCYPDGINEYDLMQALQDRGDIPVLENAFSSKLNMFRAHFILYHALYLLRDRLWEEQTGHLEINSVMVYLQDYRQGETALMPADPLREYYLDLSNLELTSAADVEALLNAFWIKFNAQNERESALRILQLEEPCDISAIKTQYRRLAMLHHPDRGGSKTELQKINAAKRFLLVQYARESKRILD